MSLFKSKTQYEIFDIYNNGFTWGGKLRIVFNRLLEVRNQEIYGLTFNNYPKTIQRKSFDDITLRIGLSVSKIFQMLGIFCYLRC